MILPGAAYTEQNGTYVNTEGRVQRGDGVAARLQGGDLGVVLRRQRDRVDAGTEVGVRHRAPVAVHPAQHRRERGVFVDRVVADHDVALGDETRRRLHAGPQLGVVLHQRPRGGVHRHDVVRRVDRVRRKRQDLEQRAFHGVEVLRELGIGLVPYSPLGRGMLSGAIDRVLADPDDSRGGRFPRFQGEALETNLFGAWQTTQALALADRDMPVVRGPADRRDAGVRQSDFAGGCHG